MVSMNYTLPAKLDKNPPSNSSCLSNVTATVGQKMGNKGVANENDNKYKNRKRTCSLFLMVSKGKAAHFDSRPAVLAKTVS